ncbi:telomerase Cajal body protein 1-like [Ptychodera flava]|uniref:telomerase Cajal body protein 1-like n=1 Tax=Ptychodera flava TaxID=63121 RepID=UPI003969D073
MTTADTDVENLPAELKGDGIEINPDKVMEESEEEIKGSVDEDTSTSVAGIVLDASTGNVVSNPVEDATIRESEVSQDSNLCKTALQTATTGMSAENSQEENDASSKEVPSVEDIATHSVAVSVLEQQNDCDMNSQDQIEGDNMDCDYSGSLSFSFDSAPVQMTGAWSSFDSFQSNFLKGCKWSPDGSCILTNSDDDNLRVFNLPAEIYLGQYSEIPEMVEVFSVPVGELIYDYAWYPLMNSTKPDTCLFVSSSRDHPVQMWDAFTGQLKCTYRAFNHLDEMTTPHCVAFSLNGKKLYCGFDKNIKVFDTNRPGRECEQRPTHAKKKGQCGIISCIAMNPTDPKMYAAGSYSKSVGIYSEPNGKLEFLLCGHQGGLTHMKFSPDGNVLYTGSRKDSEILCWDIRNPGVVMFRMIRDATTNQRMYFDIDCTGQFVVSGNQNGTVTVWDTTVAAVAEHNADTEPVLPPVLSYFAHGDCVNGVSLHPILPVMATTSGQRKFPVPMATESDSDDDISTTNQISRENSLRLWSCLTAKDV